MAHGFLTLEDMTIVTYMVKGEYNPNSEHSIVWHTIEDTKDIIESMLRELQVEITISEKDNEGK
jgi:dTDP-4-dehydrorhamnose 3,5-epimerase-like enzyme